MKTIDEEKEAIKYKMLMALVYIVYYWKELSHFSYSLADLTDINSFTKIICTLMLRIVVTGILFSCLKSVGRILKYGKMANTEELYSKIERAEDKTFPLQATCLVLFCVTVTYLVLSLNAKVYINLIWVLLMLLVQIVLFRHIVTQTKLIMKEKGHK